MTKYYVIKKILIQNNKNVNKLKKLKMHHQQISSLYNEVFRFLPLASLVDNKIYVVHGGISEKTLLKDILKIKREKYVSIIQSPMANDRNAFISSLSLSEINEWSQVFMNIHYFKLIN
jgi:serine/threonine-protein phosphatase with EF-hand domain